MKQNFSKKLLTIVLALFMLSSVFGVPLSAYADVESDKKEANLVMDMINKIPATITMADCANITEARRYYISLDPAPLALVTNYDKLVAAEKIAFQFPGQITSTVTQDPAHSMSFTWTTKNINMTDEAVKIWPTSQPESSSTSIKATVRMIEAQVYLTKYATDKTNTYTATATGLTPNTSYSYRVGTTGFMSDICKFSTATEDNSKFTFTMLADVQTPLGAKGSIPGNNTFAAVAKKVPNSAFTYFAGDFTDLASQYEWNGFFGAGGDQLFQNFMTVGVEGNHEVTGYDGATLKNHVDTNATLLNEHFNFPSVTYNGKVLRNCYSFDYGPVHFTAVNTNYSDQNLGFNPTSGLKEMAAWLDSDVSSSKKPWKILLLHKTLYSGGTHASMEDLTELRKALTPVITKNNINAVLGGHDHIFSRGFVDKAGAKVTPTIMNKSVSSFKLLSSPQGSAKPTTTPGAIYTIESITQTVLKPDAPLYFMNGTAGGLKWYAQNPDYVKPTFKIAEGDPFTKNYTYLDRNSSASPTDNIQEQFYSVISATKYELKLDTFVYNYSIDPTAAEAKLYDSITIVDYKPQLEEATTAVSKAEASGLQEDVSAARILANSLKNDDQVSFNERLDKIQANINDAIEYSDKLEAATSAVVQAENSKLLADVTNAKTFLTDLKPMDQTALTSRLTIVQNIITAANTVAIAEKSKTKSTITKAQSAVNKLPASQVKTALQKRLKAIKAK